MTVHWVDWALVIGLLVALVIAALLMRRFATSVAGFLTSSRQAGRYIICTGEFMGGTAAISVVAMFQMTYFAGLCPQFWNMMALPVSFIIVMTGWVVYRYRATRSMTSRIRSLWLPGQYTRPHPWQRGVLETKDYTDRTDNS